MSGLRQVIKKDVTEAADLEAQEKEPLKDSSESEGKNAATAFATASATDSMPAGSHNPVFIAKIIFRKVAELLISTDEEDLTQPAGIITLLKDIVLGIILGVLTISVLIFLDHHNIVHFQSAHNFRNAAFQLMNDPETIANLEESSDLKFITLNDYNAKRGEIDGVAEKIAKSQEILEKRTAEAEAKKTEAAEVKKQWDAMYHNPLLKLDKYCGSCKWGMKFTCDGRVNFLQDTYNTKPIQAKISAMTHASCIKG